MNLNSFLPLPFMIIAVTGLNAAGKDTIAGFLQEKGFIHYSLSDFIRDELKKRKLALTRDNLIKVGTELRSTFGNDVLALHALNSVKDGENYVLTSVRNVDEVKTIVKRKDALLIKVEAPIKERLRRLIARKRAGDPTTLEELKKKEKEEMSDNPSAQQMHKVLVMAKVTIDNSGTLDLLRTKIDRLVEDYLYKLVRQRPSWDEYFMNVAEIVKLRSTCLSASKGAVLVKDKRIISTGYNGSPRGIKHCNLGGCLRCTQRHLGKIKSGNYSEPCICCHSEENAIVQAAVHGISTNGSTMYTTFTPCVNCAKIIINAGILEVVAQIEYPDDVGLKLLKESGVTFRLFK